MRYRPTTVVFWFLERRRCVTCYRTTVVWRLRQLRTSTVKRVTTHFHSEMTVTKSRGLTDTTSYMTLRHLYSRSRAVKLHPSSW